MRSGPRFREDCSEAIGRIRLGRCNLRELRNELPSLLKACFAPLLSSGLADRCDLAWGRWGRLRAQLK